VIFVLLSSLQSLLVCLNDKGESSVMTIRGHDQGLDDIVALTPGGRWNSLAMQAPDQKKKDRRRSGSERASPRA